MSSNEPVTYDKSLDSTKDLMQEGYMFIKNRMDKYETNVFETRLLGKKTICMSGEEATKLFYDSDLFKRKGAVPKRIQKTLFGVNAIQTMDGEEHSHRKHLFISMLTPVNERHLSKIVKKNWETCIDTWVNSEKVILFNEANEVLCRSAYQWTGVPIEDSDIKNRADDFSSMIDAFGAVGPRHWKGRISRDRTEEWLIKLIKDVRSGKQNSEEGTILYSIAFCKDINGEMLSNRMAAIELINVLRPIVAISTFITFSALALHHNSECKDKLLSGNSDYFDMFTQEVRRYYPFAPMLGAVVRKNFNWNQCEFKEGMTVLLDIYGTNHDSKIWVKPFYFIPERFKDKKHNQYDFIPQGGGDSSMGHRCPGEGITVEIMKASLDFLVNKIEYTVPDQDLSYDLSKMPTLPESGFLISDIKQK